MKVLDIPIIHAGERYDGSWVSAHGISRWFVMHVSLYLFAAYHLYRQLLSVWQLFVVTAEQVESWTCSSLVSFMLNFSRGNLVSANQYYAYIPVQHAISSCLQDDGIECGWMLIETSSRWNTQTQNAVFIDERIL